MDCMWIVVTLCLAIKGAYSYPGGAPTGQCSAMTPSAAASGGHGATPQTGAAPYSIAVQSTTTMASGPLTFQSTYKLTLI